MGSVDDYLASVRKEAFNVDDTDVVLIDPGMDSRKAYEEVDLPCEQEKRINNALDAPVRKLPKADSNKRRAVTNQNNDK